MVASQSVVSPYGGSPTQPADLGFLGASVRLSGPLLSQSCISGGLICTRAHDRLKLSRLDVGIDPSLHPREGADMGQSDHRY